MSWVKNDVNQFGLYLSHKNITHLFLCSVRKEQQQIAKAEFYNILLSLFGLKSDYNISISMPIYRASSFGCLISVHFSTITIETTLRLVKLASQIYTISTVSQVHFIYDYISQSSCPDTITIQIILQVKLDEEISWLASYLGQLNYHW